MYCPNCGKTNSPDQNFCRACGLSLELTARSLAEQRTPEELEQHLRDRRRRVEKWLNIIGWTAGSALVASVLWGIFYHIIIVKGEVLEGSIFLAFIVGVVLFALLAIYRDSLVKASAKRPVEQEVMPGRDTARFLPDPCGESIPGVTERTTELMSEEIERRNPGHESQR